MVLGGADSFHEPDGMGGLPYVRSAG